MQLFILSCCILTLTRAIIMNQGGGPYAISNPPGSTANWKGTPGTYSTDFEKNVVGKVEHFDVYGEVQTMYSQVYWTRNAPIDLPPQIVSRFKDKVMVITGYEVDQVTHSGPKPGYVRTQDALGGFSCYPDCSEGDKSVPMYHAYNHHYFSWLTGSDAEMYELEEATHMPNPTTTGFRRKEGTEHGYPVSIVFKENPGGEFRKSYHGYPNGYGQFIHSPSQWIVEPMQIDTHNRNYSITDQEGYIQSFLPKVFHNNMTNLKNGLSPLIECPCTDRITKTTVNTSSILTSGNCQASINSLKDCVIAVNSTGAKVTRYSTIDNPNLPAGCLIKPDTSKSGSALAYSAYFNAAKSTKPCGTTTEKVSLHGYTTISMGIAGINGVKVALQIKDSVLINITGPSGVWYGTGFNAKAMSDTPYAIIVDGNGHVTERKLVNHGPGTLLAPSLIVISSSVQDNVRTVTLRRNITGATTNHFTFPTIPGDINLIAAIGSTPDLSYHKIHSGGQITLLPASGSACVCQPTSTFYIAYMDTTKQQFDPYNCVDEPRSDMLKHGDGTGRQVPNQACFMKSYHGGLKCCKNSWFLTDRDQDSLIPKDKVDTYYLKWRYYFQEYRPATLRIPASHKHIHHWVFLIDEQVNDYEEDNAKYGTKSIGKISAHLQARNMGLEDISNPTADGAPPVPSNFSTITPLVMTPHCHAPSCIRQEFWNADTGEIICNMTAMYGDEKYGSTNKPFNEKDYITILPCIFGHQPGLQFPFNLTPDTNITAIKYFNNTYRHLGQMAQWTGLMVYDTDPY